MNCTVNSITDELHRLVDKLEKRENNLDTVKDTILDLQSRLTNQHRCQEDSLSFEELAKRVKNHPRGWLILCLAAENKEFEQLQIENRTLCDSLEKHQAALDLIVKKYRLQVSQLMQTNRMENLIHSKTSQTTQQNGRLYNTPPVKFEDSPFNEALVKAELVSARDPANEITNAILSARVSTLASMARDICDHGESYTTQLESELRRLQLENSRLRELLMISSDTMMDTTEMNEITPSTEPTSACSTPLQPVFRSELSVLPPNQNSCNASSEGDHPPGLTSLLQGWNELLPYERELSPKYYQNDNDDDNQSELTVIDGSEHSD